VLTILFIIAVWFMLSVPVALLVGGMIRYGQGD
jgi:hypothetical protein